MLPRPSSRRDFLRTSGLLAAGGGLALSLPGCREAAEEASEAINAGDGPRVLTPDEIRTLEAFSDRILPPEGDAPGAGGLGAAVFIDHYAARRSDILEQVRGALAGLADQVQAAHPGVGSFADLSVGQADALMGSLVEQAPQLFWPLQSLVVFGAFAAPAHGGNREKAGWALLGYDDRMVWQPPFGFYDAEAAKGGDR